ncbi:hypothetical protein [Bradyrhizobium sp. WSM4349]|uniref:hypothetical protein n=1 Tax=Bradyrhizobium sp. WSM4349 TaxID=1040988 RepID=UPI001FD98E6A|nr:hypothetical protein [Bradyrhizobium sp. WSM4349]
MTNTLAHPDVTGDGLSLAVRVGAGIDKDVASAGFWTPGSIFKSGSASQVVPCGWLDRGRAGASQRVRMPREFVVFSGKSALSERMMANLKTRTSADHRRHDGFHPGPTWSASGIVGRVLRPKRTIFMINPLRDCFSRGMIEFRNPSPQ